MVEVLTKYLKDVFDSDPRLPARIRAYRGGYLPTERREAERAMRDGRVDGIISTSALELGVDIGSLDAVVLNGYPGARNTSDSNNGTSISSDDDFWKSLREELDNRLQVRIPPSNMQGGLNAAAAPGAAPRAAASGGQGDRRRNGVGQAVQIDVAFAQRLAVIGDIDHRRVVRGVLREHLDRLGQEVIRFQDGVVVGVDDLLPRAAAQIRGTTVRPKLTECFRSPRVDRPCARDVAACTPWSWA